MTINVPRFKAFINTKFLGNSNLNYIEGYIFAVTLIENRPLLWTVHTIDGAVWSRIPTWAIKWEHKETMLNGEYMDADIWGAISSNGHAIVYDYLKDYQVFITKDNSVFSGMYKFTIDYFDGGFAEDPEQHKTSNIIFLDNGQVVSVPNNFCLFKDKHFTTDEDAPLSVDYKRRSIYYTLD